VARVDDALVHDESDGRARLLVVLGKDGGCETLLVIRRREEKSRLLDRRELPRRIEQRVDAGLAAVRLRREPPAHQTVVKTTSNCTSDAWNEQKLSPTRS
jgi:hypothetical protein